MLAKESRLTAFEVREILKAGRSARTATLSAKYIPAESAKAAVVISTKVATTAVKRNALRRAAYRTLRVSLPARKHVVIFLQRPALDPAELTELCSKLS